MSRTTSRRLLRLATALALLGLLAPPMVRGWQRAANPLRQAAARLQQRGAYAYDARIDIDQQPQPLAENVGLTSQRQQLAVQGSVDLRNETMDLRFLSGDGGLASGTGIVELQIADGVTRSRNPAGEWQAAATPAVFGGNNDVLAYLQTARDISTGQREQRGGIDLTRYSFEIDAQAFAQLMREHMERELRQSGRLPASMELGLVSAYLGMTGSGEVWLDDAGLPLRQAIKLTMPDETNGQLINANFTINFSNIPPAPLGGQIAGWLAAQNWPALQGGALGLAILLGLALALSRSIGSRRAYALVTLATITSMLGMPLVQADQALAFAAASPTVAAQAPPPVNLSAAPAGPTYDPLTPPQSISVARPLAAGGPNSDGDGLTDSEEALVSTNPANPDTDDDGLRDDIEVLELGTRPTASDTDGDGLSDGLEVSGVTGPDGRIWYLDPFRGDSNNDGLADLAECVGDPACPDTDGDALPDAFDADNDNDGVADRIDDAPTRSINGGMSNGQPLPLPNQAFSFDLKGYNQGRPLALDITLRPTNPAHLWYNGNVLDWPTDDRAGQVQRVKDTTLTSSGKGANGDMQLVPLLEIEIPYDANGAFGGLPVKPNVSAMPPIPRWTGVITADEQLQNEWFDAWLDRDRLNAYQVAVRLKDDNRTVLAYVPLDVVRDPLSNSPAAFRARMLYQPKASAFGPAHTMRLAWAVQVLKDSCAAPPPADSVEAEAFNRAAWDALPAAQRQGDYITWANKTAAQRRDAWCQDPNHWSSKQAPVQTYYDDFYLSALTVTEDQGLDVTVALQKPGTSAGGFEQHLWNLARSLDRGLLGGRRDLTSQELVRRFNGSPAGVSAAERWGIPAGTLHAATYHFIDEGDQARLFAGHQQNGVTQTALLLNELNQTYVNAAGQTSVPTATVLLAREWKLRIASLDAGITVSSGAGGAAATIDITSAPTLVQAGIKWQPFTYLGGRIWRVADHQGMLDQLAPIYEQTLRQQPNFSGASAEQVAGAVTVLKNYFMALIVGRARLVELNGQPNTNTTTPINDASLLAPASPGQSLAATALAVADLVVSRQQHRMLSIEVSAQALLTAIGRQKLYQDGGLALSLLNGLGNLAAGDDSAQFLARSMIGVSAGLQKTAATASEIYARIEQGADIGANALDVLLLVGFDSRDIVGAVTKARSLGSLTEIWKASSTAAKQLFSSATSIYESVGGWATVVAVVVSVVISFVKFLALLDQGWNSVAFDKLVLELTGTVTYAILMGTIGSIVPIGTVIAVLAAIVDVIIFAICSLTTLGASEDAGAQTFCQGIAGNFAKLFADLVQPDPGIVNLDDPDRLDLTDWQVAPHAPGSAAQTGYIQGNVLDLKVRVRTRLPLDATITPQQGGWFNYTAAEVDDYLRDSTFAYEFTTGVEQGGERIHVRKGLDTGDMPDAWSKDAAGIYNATTPITQQFTLDRAAVNWRPAGLFLAEGYAIDTWRCMEQGGLKQCGIPVTGDNEDSNYLNLSDNMVFDVFPPTLDSFYALTDRGGGGFALAWDAQFPLLKDADGDGLRARTAGGNDPADNDPDSDDDGLGDFYEIMHEQAGFNPLRADTDNDGLTDYDELGLATNPAAADADNDGLTDGEEIAGWQIVYGYDALNRPLRFRTGSDPADPDTDNDGLLDKQEKTYGFNPRVLNSGEALSILSQIDEADGRADGIVADSSLIGYSATITNTLADRYALGLFELGLPAAASSANLLPQEYVLGPRQQTTLSGAIQLADLGVSQKTTLINRAGAIIADLRGLSGGRSLWLHFDEPAGSMVFKDSGVLGHNAGCLVGMPCPGAGETGYLGRATRTRPGGTLRSILQVPAAADLDTAQWSVSLWVNPAATSEEFVAKRAVSGTTISYSLGSDSNNKPRLHVQAASCAGDSSQFLVGNAALQPNRWTLLTATYDGATLKFYVNAVLDQSQPYAGGTCRGLTPIMIGAAADNTMLDELSIYPFALNAAEVRDQFRAPVLRLTFDGSVANSSPLPQSVGIGGNSSITLVNDRDGDRTAQFDKKRWITASADAANPTLNLSSGDGRFTLASWLRPVPLAPDFNNWVGVMGNEQGSNGAASYPSLYAKFPSQTGAGTLKIAFGNGAIRCESGETGAWLQPGAWQHLAIAYSGSQFIFYLNGAERERLPLPAACTGSRPASNGTLYIGRTSPNAQLTLIKIRLFGDEGDGSTNAEYFSHWDGMRFWQTADDSVADNYEHLFTGAEQPPAIWDDNAHQFQLWEDDPSYDDLEIEETVRNSDISLGNTEATRGWNYSADGNGTVTYRLWNQFFNGGLDDVRVYRHAFSSQDAQELYRASTTGSYALNLRFEEPPTTRLFRDGSGNLQHGLCAESCPTSGLPGRDGQAARFGGAAVVVPNAPALKQENGLAVAAWIKLDATGGSQSLASKSDGSNGYQLSVVNGTLTTALRDANGMLTTLAAGAIPANVWTHVAMTANAGGQIVHYVNGQLVGSAPIKQTARAAIASAKPTLGGSATLYVDANYSDDDKPTYRVTGSNPDLDFVYQNEASSARANDICFSLHEDNNYSGNSLMICDDTPTLGDLDNDNDSVKVYANPAPIVGGWLRLNADEAQHVVVPRTKLSVGLSALTVAAWMQPTAKTGGQDHTIMATGSGDPNQGFKLTLNYANRSLSLRAGNGQQTSPANLFPNDGNPHHVAVTLGGGTLIFYIDGSERYRTSFAVNVNDVDLPVLIGRSYACGISACDFFQGGLRDVALYARPLNALEISSLANDQPQHVDATARAFHLPFNQNTSDTMIAAPLSTNDQPLVIGRSGTGGNALHGLIDELAVMETALPAADIAALYNRAPVLNMHFDEQLGAASFADWSPALGGGCVSAACPQSGARGRIRETAVFTDHQIFVDDRPALNPAHLSLELWVRPRAIKGAAQTLLEKTGSGSSSTGYGLELAANSLRLRFVNCGTALASSGALNLDQWNHVTATADGGSLKLYINGVFDSARSAGPNCANTYRLNLGNTGYNTAFDGSLDELAIYSYALDETAVKARYDYQAAWFDVAIRHELTIDADLPDATVALAENTLIPNRTRVLAISAADPTSPVVKVEYNTGAGWRSAAHDGSNWLFTYAPTAANGPVTIQTRATDSVGHQSPPRTRTLIADGTAPTLTLNPLLTTGIVRPLLNAATNTWDLPLAGSATDSASAPVRVTVTLRNIYGIAGTPFVLSGINGPWSSTYRFTTPPNGRYEIEVSAEDRQGNVTTLQNQVAALDGTGPIGDIISHRLIGGPSASAMLQPTAAPDQTLRGTVSDTPAPLLSALNLHFEEPGEAGGMCAASACPAAAAGMFGASASFDGLNDTLAISASLAPARWPASPWRLGSSREAADRKPFSQPPTVSETPWR